MICISVISLAIIYSLFFPAIFAKNEILKNLNKTYMSYLARK
nr:MAG TPA: hypothetical protein [Caudoviricetes sp.]